MYCVMYFVLGKKLLDLIGFSVASVGTGGSCSVESSKGSCLKVSDIHILERSQISVNSQQKMSGVIFQSLIFVCFLEKLLDLVGFSVASVVTGSQGGALVSCSVKGRLLKPK